MQNSLIHLKDRKIIEIKGLEAAVFLQALITNNIVDADEKTLVYSAMLSPQGRFLYDFFVFKQENSIFLDCNEIRAAEILKKLNFYKLRRQLEIKLREDFLVAQIFTEENLQNQVNLLIFKDLRHKEIGFRGFFVNQTELENFAKSPNSKLLEDSKEYHFKRINLKIAESEYDLTYDKSFILEYGFDDLKAIDYKKGCYVGQENTARTHYKGVIRKHLFVVEIEGLQKIEKGSAILLEQEEMGIILSSVFIENKLIALSLIKNIDNNNQEISLRELVLTVQSNKVKILK